MNYQQARETRETNLFRLIAEKKFEEGQGLGSSIGGAISDKFKAKAVGLKESLDPLNFTRKIFGKGLIGDVAVTGLGRLFGRKESDIANFGGFRGKKRSKDPRYSTISAGPIRPLRMGDSSADILGKILNFMVLSDQRNRLTDDIEKNFRQEQMDEDNRRHKALVDAIRAYTKGGKSVTATPIQKEKEKEGNGFWDDISNWAKKLLGGLEYFAAGVAGLLGFKKVSNIFKNYMSSRKPGAGVKLGSETKVGTGTKPGAGVKLGIEAKPGSETKAGTGAKPGSKGPQSYAESLSQKKNLKGTPEKPGFLKDAVDKIRENAARIAKESSATKISAPIETTTATKVPKASTSIGGKVLFGANVAATGALKIMNFLGSITGAASLPMIVELYGEAEQLLFDALNPDYKMTTKEASERGGKILAKFFGGRFGMLKGAALGTAAGTLMGGPLGAFTGMIAGGIVGMNVGSSLGEAAFYYLQHGKLPPNNPAIDYAKQNGFVVLDEQSASFGTQVKGVKKRSDIIPAKVSSNMGLSPGEEVVQQNNTINNVGGSQPKVVSLNTARSRNVDLERQNHNIMATV